MDGGEKKICIEAKSLGQSIDGSDVFNQAVSYAKHSAVPWLAVTNGTGWKLYDLQQPLHQLEKSAISWDIVKDDPS